MVFSQYRESVFEITELLQTFKPLIKPMQFVGHQGSSLSNDGNNSVKKRRFTQNDQLKVIEEFRKGNFNTLVSTCIDEWDKEDIAMIVGGGVASHTSESIASLLEL